MRGRLIHEIRAAVGGGGPASAPGAAAAYLGDHPPDAASLRRLVQDPGLRREVAATALVLDVLERPRRRAARLMAGLAAVAAGTALLVAIPPAVSPDAEGRLHRADGIGGAPPHVTSRSDGRGGLTVVWSTALGADRYVVEITRDDGRLLFSRETADTALTLPDSVLVPSAARFVRVRARVAPGRWVTSEFHDLAGRP